MFKMLRLIVLFCLAFTATDLMAAGSRQTISTQRGSGISIEVQPYYNNIPQWGFVPVRVTIGNHSERSREWTLRTQDRQWRNRRVETQGNFRFEVPAQDTRVFDILIPIGAQHISSSYSGGVVALQFSGYGVPIDHGRMNLHRLHQGHRGGAATAPFTGMSMDLHTRNWGDLTSTRSGIQGAGINPERLPGDWRGLSGFDVIWLSDNAWRLIGGIERRALLDWLASGGRLVVSYDGNDDSPARLTGLPAETTAGDPVPHGYGHIHFHPRQGNELDHDVVANFLLTLGSSRNQVLGQGISEGNWEMFHQVGLPSIPVVFFSIFLTAFAILIGPVNFMAFARPGQRHRLLWTTPLISLTAGALLLLLILFQDGTGGSGMRLAVWHHLPQDNRAVLFQEQTALTGLLLSSRFAVSEPAVMNQLNLNTGRTASGRRFQLNGNHYQGDWFLSRSTQSQLLHAVPATRSRIEISNTGSSAGDAPEVASTFSYDADIVFYRDDHGTLWTGGPLIPGTPLTLERCEPLDFEEWWQTQFTQASPATRTLLSAQRGRTGYFYASASGAFNGPETLTSIRWREQHSLHLGPIISNR